MRQYTVRMATYHTVTVNARSKTRALENALNQAPRLQVEGLDGDYGKLELKSYDTWGNWEAISCVNHARPTFSPVRDSGKARE